MKANKPLEWTGHHLLSATPPHALCLPLRGSVRSTGGQAELPATTLMRILVLNGKESPS